MRSSISVLLRCKHSLMSSRTSSNSFINSARENVCSSWGSNGTRPSMTTQLRLSDPFTLVFDLSPVKETWVFSEKEIHIHICEDGYSTDLWKIFHWLSKLAAADEFCMADLEFSARSCPIRHLAGWHVSHINPKYRTHRRNSRRFVIADLRRHLKQS